MRSVVEGKLAPARAESRLFRAAEAVVLAADGAVLRRRRAYFLAANRAFHTFSMRVLHGK